MRSRPIACLLGVGVALLASCRTEPQYSTEPSTGTTTITCQPRLYPWTYLEPDTEIHAQGIGGTIATNPALIRVIINDGANNIGFRIARADLSQPFSTNQDYTFRWEWRKSSKPYESCQWVHRLETRLLSVEKNGIPLYVNSGNSTNGYENLMQRTGGKPF